MDRKEIIKRIENDDNVKITYNRKWRYPRTADDQKTCPMLQVMLDIEYNSGTIIFIPDKENQFGKNGNTNRNTEEG